MNDGNCQRQGVGAIVEVVAGDKRSRREIQAGRGTGSQDSLVQHFGLGGYDGPVSIEVTTLCGQHYSARLSAPNQRISMPLER